MTPPGPIAELASFQNLSFIYRKATALLGTESEDGGQVL
jgi:hypothetical protein